MIFTAEQYAKKHKVTLSTARKQLKDMWEAGSVTRKRSGNIGGTYVYEFVNTLKAHDPFNLRGNHG